MKPRKTALFLSCLMLISTAAANVSAAERNEDHTNYEVSSEKFAARLKTIDGLNTALTKTECAFSARASMCVQRIA